VIELNVPQRCAAHLASQTDLDEAFRIGHEAVLAALSHKTGVMMGFERMPSDVYGCRIVCNDIHQIANQVKHVPEHFINNAGNHVTDECCHYILPLIQGEAYPSYKNGLPQFL
jgi:6-phosphofructokinase 1